MESARFVGSIPEHLLHYHDADEIEDALAEAGFSQSRIEELHVTSKIPSAEVFSRGLVFGNPLYQEIVNRGGSPDAICEPVTDAVERQLGSEMPLQALVACASK